MVYPVLVPLPRRGLPWVGEDSPGSTRLSCKIFHNCNVIATSVICRPLTFRVALQALRLHNLHIILDRGHDLHVAWEHLLRFFG